MKQQSLKWQRIIVLIFWIALILSFWLITRTQNITLNQLLQQLVNFAKDSPFGIAALFAAYLIRPVLLLPSTLLVVASGYLYGIAFGFIVSLAATLLSLIISYYIAAYFRSETTNSQEGLGNKFVKQLKDNPFQSTLIARLVFMPGDLVNLAAGFCKINLASFLAASAIGGAPGLLMAVLAGASIEGDFDAGSINIRISYLIAASLILLASLGLSWLIRKRQKRINVQ